ncbi:MAG: NAD(P)-dependent oxidoreductase [Pseudomonadota bacterium]|jgi:3-hydroxyisobutyrate dehydrogenase|nr:NAD(P)-dependent oxidoreductase [Pseudomonadota bacterium]
MVMVAFLGLGRMGLGMAGRLRSTGVELRVFNRTASRADALVAAGARRCATPREACMGAVAAFSMVADDAASRALWLGADGALGALPSGAMLIECSTLSHDWVLELSARAAAVDVRYLDAPVTGLPEQAADGALTLLVGAHRADLEAARPLLDALARSIIHFGPIGTGTAYKLLVNLLGAVQIASAAEAMAFGERAGLEPMQLAQALGSGQAASPQVIRNTRRMAENQHAEPVHFTPQLRLKDVEYALALARKLGAGAPFGALAARWFGQLAESMPAGVNESAIIEVARRQHP